MNNAHKLKWSNYIYKKQNNSKMFKLAFTHTSYKGLYVETNEILELIGDKVLDLILYHLLYKTHASTISKIEMDNKRQKLMSATGLEIIFDTFNLGNFMIKPPNHYLPLNPKVKHNIVEALCGAIYLEDGYKTAYEFITLFI